MTKIESVQELLDKVDTSETPIEIALFLRGGARSSKRVGIADDSESICIYHEIDDSEQIVTKEQFKTHFISQAIGVNAAFYYED